MPVRNAIAVWEGNLKDGKGRLALGSGLCKGAYSFSSRFEQGAGTNPEELIAAAHAGCFSMALSGLLQQQGYTAEHIHTTARVTIEKSGDGWRIANIELETEGKVSGVEEASFRQLAEDAKRNCPVSRALESVPIRLNARLVRPLAA
ncbi:MAG: peroxiredoxin [Nitrospirae bacterium GWD2_57_9]|nr:MAG: peroxiredoxin [Nitrospirae bacterium GWD2_57_9]OGW47883.1 MAG: peroxiredoxin [Nitrospirae bacterium GWC2_57_9]